MDAAAPTRSTPRPKTAHPWARAVTIVGLVLLGLGALAGGFMLVTSPDGSSMGFGLDLLAGSPFPDFLVPRLILAGLFGVGSLVVAVTAVRDHPAAPYLAFAIGCAQMIWIVVELAIIGEFSFLHPTMFLVGLVIAVGAAAWGWPAFQARRAPR